MAVATMYPDTVPRGDTHRAKDTDHRRTIGAIHEPCLAPLAMRPNSLRKDASTRHDDVWLLLWGHSY